MIIFSNINGYAECDSKKQKVRNRCFMKKIAYPIAKKIPRITKTDIPVSDIPRRGCVVGCDKDNVDSDPFICVF